MKKLLLLRNYGLKSILVLGLLFLFSNNSWGQTNPNAFALSGGNFSFTSQTVTNTTYPANMQGWATSANNIAVLETNAPASDQALVASGTSSTSGLSNLGTNGFQFLSTSSSPNKVVGSICVAINTIGRQDVKATWTASDESATASLRIMALTLQYRIGTSGTFTTIPNSTYTSATSSKQAPQTFSNVALPNDCINQAIVQLRWIYYETPAQSGSRDPIRLDEITVSSSVLSCPTFNSTITINPTSTPVPGSVYKNLSDVVGYLNGCSVSQPIVIELANGYNGSGDLFPISLRAVSGASSSNKITIRPASGATAVNFSSAAGANTIFTINGGNYWTIDGRAGGIDSTNILTIENTSITASSPAILLINGAQNNTITYTNVKSANTSTTSALAGTIAFSTSTALVGNSNNTISYCNISDASTGTSTVGILSSPTGTTTADARFNNNNTLTYNNIYNFYNATSTAYVGAGILISNDFNSDWTITYNSIYQTTSRSVGGIGADFIGIYVNGKEGGNFNVSNNYIGGTGPNCGSTPMTYNLSTTVAIRGMYFSLGVTNPSTISYNTIKNISFTTATNSSVNAGISFLNGAATISYNTIGALDVDASSSPSINFVSGGSGSTNFNGILAGTGTTSQGGITISNNSIGGIKCSSAGAGPIALSGIRIESGTGSIITAAQYNVTSNTIGSTTTSNSLYNTSNNNIHGIYNLTTNTALANSITGNTIANLASNVTTAMITSTATVGTGGTASVSTYVVASGNTLSVACGYGSNFVVSGGGFPTGSYISAYASTTSYTITYPTQGSIPTLTGNFTVTETPQNQVIGFRSSSGSSACTFSNNSISNFSSNLSNPFANSGGTFSALGIYSSATAGGLLFSGNTIHSLSGTNLTVAQAVAGIYTTGQNSGTASIIEKNNIHSLFLATNSTSGSLFGVYENAYPLVAKNNIIRLGLKNDGTSITTGYQIAGIYDAVTAGATSNYFNSVYIAGSSVTGSASNTYALQSAGSTNARDYRNNILFNARSNSSSSTGKNYAYRIAETTSLTSDFNDIFANGTDGVLGYYVSEKTTLSDWKTATTTDANSISTSPNFTSTTNLLPTTGENLIGTSITGITTDYENSNRVGIPSMGAYEVSIPNCWTGNTDTDYSKSTNWEDGTVPASGNNITIPSFVTNSPVLDTDKTIGNIFIGTNKTIDINGKTLTLNGLVFGTGTIKSSATSNLTIGGASGTLNFTSGSRTIKDLTLNSSATATLGTALDITAGATSGTVTVGSGATLSTGGFLTLKSDANGTASVGNSAGTITGNVTVERYIPAKRSWRALTAPLKGSNSSIFSQWQNNGTVSTGVGVELWHPSGDATPSSSNTGLAVGPNSSILQYVNTGTGAWSAVANTNSTNLFTTNGNNAFMVFPTGGYGSGKILGSTTPEDTTLKATGQLIIGQVPYTNLPNTSHTLIGNPYASPLDPVAILTSNASLGGNIWVWDANTLGSNNVGCYNLFNSGAYSNVTGSLANGVQIQSGQAFFVKPTADLASFTIEESHKGSTFSNAVFRTAAAPELLRVGLYKQVNNEWLGRDGAMTVILADANANQAPNKMANGTENIVFTKNGANFASNHHLPLVATDVLNVKVWNTTAGANYKLKINTEQFTTTNLDATLEDFFTNSRTPLALDGTPVEYPFTVTTDALSSGDRFRIVFQTSALGTTIPKATGFSIVPNPVTGDSFQVNLGTLATGSYSYSICNAIGQEVEKGSINTTSQNTNYTVKFRETAATGIYIMKIKGSDNSVFTAKLIKK